MKEFKISSLEDGQKLLKFLFKLLPNASKSLIYKSLRKKNIVYNRKKAKGDELLKVGDSIEIWFSEETLNKFMHKSEINHLKNNIRNFDFAKNILYENNDIIIINKPKSLLSQKDFSNSVSVNDYLLEYLNCNNYFGFKPSICNRLDKNTTGILICSKTFKGAQTVNKLIKEHQISKKYICLVYGTIKSDLFLRDYLVKDSKINKSIIYKYKVSGSSEISTNVRILSSFKFKGVPMSFLEVTLLTGRFHQIRAHLNFIGHPILGDIKYANAKSLEISKKTGIERQLLHAYLVKFPNRRDLGNLANLTIKAPVPEDICKILKNNNISFFDM